MESSPGFFRFRLSSLVRAQSANLQALVVQSVVGFKVIRNTARARQMALPVQIITIRKISAEVDTAGFFALRGGSNHQPGDNQEIL